MEDKQLSAHFKLSEFNCKDGTPYPSDWIESRLIPLVQMDEVIREAAGSHPMTILCGYRTPAYNEKLRERGLNGESGTTGVAQHSQHMEGRANDIAIFGMPIADLYKLINDLYKNGKLPQLGGLGFYPGHGFCHIDTYKLASGVLRKWNG